MEASKSDNVDDDSRLNQIDTTISWLDETGGGDDNHNHLDKALRKKNNL